MMENTMNIEPASILSLEQYINVLHDRIESDPYMESAYTVEDRHKLSGIREALELLGIHLVENEHGYIECVRVF